MKTKKVVYLQRVPFENPGAFAASLAEHGVQLEHHLVPRDGLPSDTSDFLIVMGGPMSGGFT